MVDGDVKGCTWPLRAAERLAMTPYFALVCAMRKIWSAAEIAQVVSALAVRDTEAVAADWGVTDKALRGLMLRNKISIRHVRKPRVAERALGGVVARRPVQAPAAIYGGDRLAELPDHACRWPIGDPSQADFSFCGAPRASVLSSYCPQHMARAYNPAPPIRLPRASTPRAALGRPKAADGAIVQPA